MENSRTKPWKREITEYSLPEGCHDDRKCGVHRCNATGGYRSERTTYSDKKRSQQKRGHLPYDVGQQCNGTEFGATVTGYEYAGEGIVAESGANGQTVCGRPSGQNQCGRKRPGECAEHSSGWKQSHSHIKGLESGDNVPATSHTYPHEEKQGTQGVECKVPFHNFLRHNSGQAGKDAKDEEAYYHKTAFHVPFFSDLR